MAIPRTLWAIVDLFQCDHRACHTIRLLEDQRRESSESTVTDPAELQDALQEFDPLWDQLTTVEQERFIRALVLEVRYDGRREIVTLGFRSNGVKQMFEAGG